MNPRVAIIFHRFGPYHWARLDACAARFAVMAIEESAETAEYQWAEAAGRASVPRRTLLGRGERPARPALEIARRLRQVLDETQPDAVAVPGWSDPAALAAIGWAARRGVPVVLMSESSALDEPRHGWKENIKRRVVALCGAGLVSGTPHAEYLASLGMPPDRIFSGYGAVDNAHFADGARAAVEDAPALRARHGLPTRYFLASSRFVAKKNLSCLLEAYAFYRAAAGDDAWRLVLLGDGPLGDTLRRQIEAVGLRPFVLLPGFRQYAELPIYYGLASAFVHASTTEQWGLVVNEAMAAGLPVIVSERSGCARDLVAEGENGYRFDPVSPAELSEHLGQLAGTSPSRLADLGAASRQIIRRWTPETFAENLQRAVESARPSVPLHAGLADQFLLRVLIWQANLQARRLLPAGA